jgi:NitT/TauT family transport system substrate-binding protein
MKGIATRVIGIILLATLVLAACAPAATAEPTAVPEPTSAPEPTAVPPTDVPTEAPAAEETEEVAAEPTEAALEPITPLDPVEKVTIAYVPIMKFATAYVAKERGFFEKYGLDVEMISVTSGTEAIAFISEGQVDVGGVAIVVSMWNGWNQGMDIKIIAPGALEPMEGSPTLFLVRKDLIDDGTVTSVEDLRGMTVATAGGPGSGGEYLAAKALERGGLSIFDVELVNIGNADMPAAFENKSIAAGVLGSPYAEQVENAGFAVGFERELTPGAMTVAFVASGKFITERPEVAKRFVLALGEAAAAMQGDQYLSDENIAAYLAYVPTTEEDLRVGAPVIYDPELNIEVEGLQDVERIHRENGRLEYSEPLDMSTVLDLSFIEWALPYLAQ